MRTLFYIALGATVITFICLFIISAIKDSKKVIKELNDISKHQQSKHHSHHKQAKAA